MKEKKRKITKPNKQQRHIRNKTKNKREQNKTKKAITLNLQFTEIN